MFCLLFFPVEPRRSLQQKKDDLAFVRQVLGRTRFELLKFGQINLSKMVVHGRIRRRSELK